MYIYDPYTIDAAMMTPDSFDSFDTHKCMSQLSMNKWILFMFPLTMTNHVFPEGVPFQFQDDPKPISFWLAGEKYRNIEGELVCPAWMVPPTDIQLPTMVLGEDDEDKYETLSFAGFDVQYGKSFLMFNQNPDTPVIIKKIRDKCYAMLVREHLYLDPILPKKTKT